MSEREVRGLAGLAGNHAPEKRCRAHGTRYALYVPTYLGPALMRAMCKLEGLT